MVEQRDWGERLVILPAERLFRIIDESSQLIAMLSKAVAKAKGKGKPPQAANF